MKYSVIIPAYQCEKTLKETVKSVLNAGLTNYEIIIVDDGSKDNTKKVCDSILEEYSQVRYVFQNNSGVSVARNKGMDLARGEYVWFVDSDDIVEKDSLSAIDKIIKEEHPDMLIFGMSFDYYYRSKCYRSDHLSYPLNKKMDKNEWLTLLDDLYSCNALSPVWNKLIRRNLLKENNIKFKEDMFIYEDLEFSIRCMSCCDTIYNSSKIIYHYRQAEDEGNAGRRLLKIDNLCTIISSIENALNFLYKRNSINEEKNVINNILLRLYYVLLQEKINVTNNKEIVIMAEYFSKWLLEKKIEHGSVLNERDWKYINNVLECKVFGLFVRKKIVTVKHKLAIIVKSTQWYQRKYRRENSHNSNCA